MKKMVSIAVVVISALLTGCATKGSLEKRGFVADGAFLFPADLAQAPENPAVIMSVRLLGDGTNSAGYAGSRMADIGRFAGGGGDLPSAVVGLGIGIVAAGVGAITGMFMDVKAQKEGKKHPDIYEVILLSAYHLDPKQPFPVPEKTINNYKRNGARAGAAYIIQFDRKDVNYKEQDVVVLKETDEKIAGRRIYRAIDIFDAKPGDTHSKQFLERIQDIARKAGVNKRVSVDLQTQATAVTQ